MKKPTPLTVDEARTLPALNGPDIICRLWQIGKGRFYQLEQEHAFDFLKTTPAVGPRCFSGAKIQRYLEGQPIYEPTFGKKRSA